MANPNRNSVFSPTFLNSKFSNSTPSKPTFLNLNSTPSKSTFPQSIFSNPSNQTLGFPHQSTQALGSSSKDISQGDTTPIENIASPIPMKKKKYRSLNEIYEITDPMEALMVDLDEENEYTQNHEPQAPFDNIHPSVRDALQSPERLQWQVAMQAEIDALEKNGTWSLVPRPNGKNIISCKWVLTKKFDSNGKLDRLKARLVARGFTQIHGIDYKDTFAPTLKMVPMRLIFSITASLNLELHHIDIETAFLHGDLDEEIYMEQPPYFVSSTIPHYVCKLHKSLYRLKQSS